MADSAPKKNRRSEIAVVTIRDDEPISQQPLKTIKKEVQEVAHSPSIAELQEQLRVADRNIQRLIVIAGEKQARIEFLEGLVDKKPEMLQAKTTEANELEKKVEELEKGRKEDQERIDEMASKLAECTKEMKMLSYNDRIIDLTNELKEERRRANEDRKRALEERMRDQERIEALTAKLEEFEQQFSLQQQQLIPVQQEVIRIAAGQEMQLNEEERSDVEVLASLPTVETKGKSLEVAQETHNMAERKNKSDELCVDMVEIVDGMEDVEVMVVPGKGAGSGGERAPINNDHHKSIMKCIQSLVHSVTCRDANCRRMSCPKMKRVVAHTKVCTKRQEGALSCAPCKQLIALCCYHAKRCEKERCEVPFCMNIRRKLTEQKKEEKEKVKGMEKKAMKRERTTSSDEEAEDGDSTVANTGYIKKNRRVD